MGDSNIMEQRERDILNETFYEWEIDVEVVRNLFKRLDEKERKN